MPISLAPITQEEWKFVEEHYKTLNPCAWRDEKGP